MKNSAKKIIALFVAISLVIGTLSTMNVNAEWVYVPGNTVYVPGAEVRQSGTYVYVYGEYVDDGYWTCTGYWQDGEWIEGGYWTCTGYWQDGEWIDQGYWTCEGHYAPGDYITDEYGEYVRADGDYETNYTTVNRNHLVTIPTGSGRANALESERAEGNVPSGMDLTNTSAQQGSGSRVYRFYTEDGTAVWAWVQQAQGNNNTLWMQVGEGNPVAVNHQNNSTVVINGVIIGLSQFNISGNTQLNGTISTTVYVPGDFMREDGEWIEGGFWTCTGYYREGQWIERGYWTCTGAYEEGQWIEQGYWTEVLVREDGEYVYQPGPLVRQGGAWVQQPGNMVYVPGEYVPTQVFVPFTPAPVIPTPVAATVEEYLYLEDLEVPLALIDEEYLYLEDLDVPLGLVETDEEYYIVIEDAPVPLAMPQTGFEGISTWLFAGLAASTAIASVSVIAIRKSKKENN